MDYVQPGNFSYMELFSVGLYRNFAPLWLRDLSVRAVKSLGHKVVDFDLIDEYTFQYVFVCTQIEFFL